MVKLKALKELYYDQKTYLAGDEFEAHEQDAATFQIIGFAELRKAKPKAEEKSKNEYNRRDMQAK